MSFKRIIPCLDVNGGRVVKGINFVDLRDVGDPAEIAKYYCEQGADELVFLDITATYEERKTVIDVVKRTVAQIDRPLCVGGGISGIDDIRALLDAGASKISINSAAVKNKELIARAAAEFGNKSIVVAIDTRKNSAGKDEVVIRGGRDFTNLDPVAWACECEKLGAGELLVTSMEADGTKNGYDIPLTKAITDAVSIPVTASGGCGSLEHFYEAFASAGADAALAASLFHFRELTVGQVKTYLKERGISVNI